MAGTRILFPYNFTSYDQKALDFVISTYARLEDADITLFNLYTPVPEVDADSTTVMTQVKGSLNYLSQKIMEQENSLKKVQEKLIQAGFSEAKVHCLFRPRKKDTASEIITCALERHAQVVVLNSKPTRIKRLFTGGVFLKVVNALRDTTIIIIT
jgi:hypothetical protein